MAKKKLYSYQDIEVARQKMLDHLASISGGEVILGCCTQGCCERQAQAFSVSLIPGRKPGAGKKK